MTRFLHVSLAVYRITVVVTWETTPAEIVRHGRRWGIASLTDEWRDALAKDLSEKACAGICLLYGADNSDVLVWLRHRPQKASQYGVLYHELYHAVAAVVRERHLGGESESPAFIYEYLATRCNQVLWPRSRRRGAGGRGGAR